MIREANDPGIESDAHFHIGFVCLFIYFIFVSFELVTLFIILKHFQIQNICPFKDQEKTKG
jgi:hypothetical protein